MKKLLPLLFLISTFAFGAYQIIPESVSVGSSKPDVSASLHLTGVTRGFVPNKMTTTQRNAIATPTAGLMIYNISGNELEVYNGSGWVSVGGGSSGGGIDQWETSKAYKIGDVVIESDKIYQALTNHTSGTFATDLANNDWKEISAMQVVDLATGVTGILPVANGGTGSSAQNFVDLTTNQTVAGEKTLSNKLKLSELQATGSSGVDVHNSSGTQIVNFGAGGGTGTSINGTTNIGSASSDYIQIAGGSGTVTQTATGSSTNIDVNIVPKGTGKLKSNSSNVILASDKLSALSSTTSSELAGIISDETGSGAAVFANTPTLVTPEIGAATGTSLTITGAFNSSLISAFNMLPNGDVELNDVSMFTCGAGNTCSRTTVSGEYSSGNAALKVATVADELDVSQTQATPSGVQKQGYMRIIYKIPAAVTDVQICTLVDAAEQTCAPSSKLVNDGLYHEIEIPLVFGSTSHGWKAKTTATNTQNFFFDGIIVAQGLGTQNLMTDNVYTAQVTNTGVVSSENKDWINGNASLTSNDFTITLVSGIFTVAPNCVVSGTFSTETSIAVVTSASATTLVVSSNDILGQPSARAFNIICQKSGNDYLNSSANVYSQASANTDWTACTFSSLTDSTTGFYGVGTVTNNLECRRNNGSVEMRGTFTVGTASGNEIRIPLPTNYGTIVTRSAVSNDSYGLLFRGVISENTVMNAISTAGLGYFKVSGALASSIISNNPTSPVAGNAFSSGNVITLSNISVPIAGWSNANLIIGSFAGVPAVPGYQGRVDTFSVAFGTGTITTPCSGTPCLIAQNSNAITSITRAGAGDYTMTTAKTYATLFCSLTHWQNAVAGVHIRAASLACTSGACTTATFTTGITGIGNNDSAGTLICQGTF